MTTHRGRWLTGCLLAGGMVLAPFLALLYHPAAGLAVMTLALLATTWLTADAGRHAPVVRRRLRIAAVVNGVLAVICAVAVLAVIVR